MVTKTRVSAEELHNIIQSLVNKIPEAKEDKAEIRVPLPTKREMDRDGCNWNMDWFGNASGYMPQIAAIMREAQSKYQLL